MIEGAVEGDVEVMGGVEEEGGAFFIDGGIGVEAAEDDAIGTVVAGLLDVGLHELDFFGGVEEIAAAGADHDHDFSGKDAAGVGEEGDAGRESAFGEGSAEFDAVDVGSGAMLNRVEAINADFDGGVLHLEAVALCRGDFRFGEPVFEASV